MAIPMRAAALGAIALSAVAQAQWNYFAGTGHLYQVVDSPGITWEAAKVAAIGMGGYLATVHSDAENNFILSLIGPENWWGPDGSGNFEGPWLGGVRTGPNPGDWAWDNGEPWDYSHWAPGEPNNLGGGENRLVYFGPGSPGQSVWNDVGGAFPAYGYVVEMVPEPTLLTALGIGCATLLSRRRRG